MQNRLRSVIANTLLILTLGLCSVGSVQANEPNPRTKKALMQAFYAWDNGDQGKCQDLLAADAASYPKDQLLGFFRALCIRSRWEIRDAFPLFRQVYELDHTSVYGRAAACIALIDANRDPDGHYATLGKLVSLNPKNFLLLWAAGVMSRHMERTEPNKGEQRCKSGIAYYKKLELLLHGKGSALVHQTYGNMLADSGQPQAALHERLLAVGEEPMPWSLKALADTYDELGQAAKAAKVRARLAHDFPGQ